jgi:hypothetical protein
VRSNTAAMSRDTVHRCPGTSFTFRAVIGSRGWVEGQLAMELSAGAENAAVQVGARTSRVDRWSCWRAWPRGRSHRRPARHRWPRPRRRWREPRSPDTRCASCGAAGPQVHHRLEHATPSTAWRAAAVTRPAVPRTAVTRAASMERSPARRRRGRSPTWRCPSPSDTQRTPTASTAAVGLPSLVSTRPVITPLPPIRGSATTTPAWRRGALCAGWHRAADDLPEVPFHGAGAGTGVPPVPRTTTLRRRCSPERSPDAACQAARVPSSCDRAGPRR